MERLTKRDEYGNADIIGVSSDVQFNLEFDELNAVTAALNRLAAYEDTGLAPEDCAAYKKFEDNLCASGVPFSRIIELVNAEKAKIAALRPITREQVEKVWRGEWEWYDEEVGSPLEGIERDWGWRCSKCKVVLPDDFDDPDNPPAMRFCQWCGAPMTDKAVQMVMERLEALKDGAME